MDKKDFDGIFKYDGEFPIIKLQAIQKQGEPGVLLQIPFDKSRDHLIDWENAKASCNCFTAWHSGGFLNVRFNKYDNIQNEVNQNVTYTLPYLDGEQNTVINNFGASVPNPNKKGIQIQMNLIVKK